MAKDKPEHHLLDCGDIDDYDEINGYDQLVWIWCLTHKKYEWHSVPMNKLGHSVTHVKQTKPVEW